MRKIAAMLVALSLALGLTAISQSSASADTVSISKTFSGFEFEKTAVTPDMKAAIQTWIALNADFTQVSCFGYTGYNVFNRSKAFLNKLAVTRAKAVCKFVNRISSKTKIKSTGGVPSSSKNPSSRRVTITLTRTGIIDPGGTGDGSATGVIGTCDNTITVKMKSRLLRGDLYFSQINMSDISNNCKSKFMDIYFTDADGAELAQALNKPVTGTTLSLLWSDFSTLELLSTTLAKVVVSIHD
jgi:hypothetical protein